MNYCSQFVDYSTDSFCAVYDCSLSLSNSSVDQRGEDAQGRLSALVCPLAVQLFCSPPLTQMFLQDKFPTCSRFAP